MSLLASLIMVGCSSPSAPSGAPRAVTGILSAQSYALDNPVVMAESSDTRVFISPLTADGRFTLMLPTNVAYRITLANSRATPGVFSAVAHINWPLESGAARWAVLGAGDRLDLGTVYRRSAGPGSGAQISSYGGDGDGGSDDGSCKEEDDAKCSHDHEDDCDCDHKYSDDDHCDKDDDGDQHDHDCDHEHGYGDVDGGCTCAGGGGHGWGDDSSYGGGSYGGHACDGGAPPTTGCTCGGGSGGAGGSGGGGGGGGAGAPGSGPGANGTPCKVNSDCASGACIASVCSPPSSQIP
jgi:hypothetical protein